MRTALLIALTACGAGATAPDDDPPDDLPLFGEDREGPEAAEGGSTETTDGTDGTDGSDGSEGGAAPIALGTWTTAGARVDFDGCGFDAALAPLGTTLALLLPEVFTVGDDPPGFALQAEDYGAEAPVSCDVFDDGSFSCDPQSVQPVALGLGAAGWRYSVAFSGVITGEGWLVGPAVVRFPSADPDTAAALAAAGVDLESCRVETWLELAPGA